MNPTARLFLFLLVYNIAMTVASHIWPITGKMPDDIKGVAAGVSISAIALVINHKLD